MRPEDTQEGRALLQEQAYLDSAEGAAEHAVGGKPCRVCGRDHSDPRDKIIAELVEALEVALHAMRAVDLLSQREAREYAVKAIAAAKVGQ